MMSDAGKQKYWEENLSFCHSDYTNPINTNLGENPGLHGENQAINYPSYNMAFIVTVLHCLLQSALPAHP
jgi:hypothetical protein